MSYECSIKGRNSRANSGCHCFMSCRLKRTRQANAARFRLPLAISPRYFAASTFFSSLRLSQLYLRWNFSTRPVVSTNFILPVKNGWHAEQISTEMFFLVLRVMNLLPQPQVTVQSSYLGWMSFFMAWLGFGGF